jgi:molybdate transport repressor ModE-like protein
MINVERLRVLHAVAASGSIQQAARVLNVTTSAVSQQISKLEREVHQPLVEKNGRGVRLTDAALLLVHRTTDVMTTLEQAEGELDEKRNEVFGRVVVSAFPTAARGVCPAAARSLRTDHPQLEVQFCEQEPHVSLPLLQRGDVDVVVAQGWRNRPLALPEGTTKLLLLEDVVDIALPARHRLARRASVELEDLADDDWITWPDGAICHEWLMFTLRSRGYEPRVAHTAGEHATQLAFVAAGLGVAVMPRLGREASPRGVKLVEVTPSLRRDVFAVWRTNAARRTSIRAVVDALRAASTR